MKVENTLGPSPQQVQDFIATDGPVCMVTC